VTVTVGIAHAAVSSSSKDSVVLPDHSILNKEWTTQLKSFVLIEQNSAVVNGTLTAADCPRPAKKGYEQVLSAEHMVEQPPLPNEIQDNNVYVKLTDDSDPFHIDSFMAEGMSALVFSVSRGCEQRILKLSKMPLDVDAQMRMHNNLPANNEALVLQKLGHLKAYVKPINRELFILPRVEGTTLRRLVTSGTVKTVKQLDDIIVKVELALERLHQSHFILHNDVHSRNILVRQSDDGASFEVDMIDFGLAKDLTEACKGEQQKNCDFSEDKRQIGYLRDIAVQCIEQGCAPSVKF
jgi:Protein kinase domain